jgi:hypothetical protein
MSEQRFTDEREWRRRTLEAMRTASGPMGETRENALRPSPAATLEARIATLEAERKRTWAALNECNDLQAIIGLVDDPADALRKMVAHIAALRSQLDEARAALRQRALKAEAELSALRKDRHEILDALADMAAQHCYGVGREHEGVFTDGGLSANEGAIDVLERFGVLERVRHDKDWYRIRWAVLNEGAQPESKHAAPQRDHVSENRSALALYESLNPKGEK